MLQVRLLLSVSSSHLLAGLPVGRLHNSTAASLTSPAVSPCSLYFTAIPAAGGNRFVLRARGHKVAAWFRCTERASDSSPRLPVLYVGPVAVPQAVPGACLGPQGGSSAAAAAAAAQLR
jgi:hypothetical protein